MKKTKFSIITPTFNRAHILHRVFLSLKNQSFDYDEFEWIVVDDGSTDETELKIREYIGLGLFSIKYLKQGNKGKHVAVNYALDFIKGDLVIIADSDDEFVPSTLDVFYRHWSDYGSESTCGIKCIVKNQNNFIFQKGFKNPKIVKFDEYQEIEKNHPGEGWFCIRSDIMKAHKFPVFEGEKFLPESLVWNKILKHYSLIICPDVLRIYYQNEPDNLSNSPFGRKSYINSPNGYIAYLVNKYEMEKSSFSRLKVCVNLSRFLIHSRVNKTYIIEDMSLVLKFKAYLLFPVGVFFYFRDKIQIRRISDV